LKDPNIWWLYHQCLSDIVNATPEVEDIEEEWKILQTVLKQAALGSLGMRRKWRNKKLSGVWTEEIKKIK
jgi:hypothetical protein